MGFWEGFGALLVSVDRQAWLAVGLSMWGALIACLKRYTLLKDFLLDFLGGWFIALSISLIAYYGTGWGVPAIIASFPLGLMSRKFLRVLLQMENNEKDDDWFVFAKKMIGIIRYAITGKIPKLDDDDEQEEKQKPTE